AQFLKTIAEAVGYAHEQGIVHRDLKPSNILIDGLVEPRITDFGLARNLKADSDLTLTGQVLGSPNYISPEQASGKAAGASSDIYSLGAILYHVLTGRPPFAGETLTDTLHQVTTKEAVSPRLLNPGIPRDLETICLKCLEKEPAKRYPTAAALAEDIGRFLENAPITARPVGKLERAVRWCRRKPAVATILILLVIVAVGSPLAALRINQERRRAETNAATAQAAVTRLEIEKAEQLFGADNSSTALAYLARILRQQPTNRVVAERILWALSHRNFALPTLAFEHADAVNAASFSPDGTRVATASRDKSARVWDSVTGAPVTPPLPHQASVTTLRFSPDGSKLATGSADKMARIWDPVSGHARTPPLQHSGAVVSLAFSLDGKLIATGSEDATAVVWHADTGQPLTAPLVHSNTVRAIAFAPDGKWLVSGSGNFACIWDVETNREPRHILNLSNTAHSVQITSDGKRILTACAPGLAETWDAATGKRLKSMGFGYAADRTPQSVSVVAAGAGAADGAKYNAEFSPEEGRLAFGGSANHGRISSARSGEPITSLRHRANVNGIRFSPDGWLVVTASSDTTARVWDAESGRAASEPLYHSGSVISAEFSPNAQQVLTVSDGGEAAYIWEIRRGQPAGVELPHAVAVAFARFSPDGRQAATASWDNMIRIWDKQTGELSGKPLFHSPQHMTSLSYSRDGRCILASSYYGLARVWDAKTGAEVCPPLSHWDADSFRHGKSVYEAVFSPDGTRIVTASADGTARLWNASNGMQLLILRHDGAARAAKFGPDGRRILTCSDDRTARMWNALDGRLIFQITHNASVVSAEFSRDGEAIVTASGKVAQRWDAHTGDRLGSPMSHKDTVGSASFSPAGWRMLTRSGSTVHVWDLRRAGESLVLQHNGAISTAVFSPDGRRILTASLGGNVRIWDSETGHPVSETIRSVARSAEFSRDGQWIITAGEDRHAIILEVPPRTLPSPAWLAELAEAVGGQRLDARNTSENVSPAELLRRVRALDGSAARDEYTRWAQWLFADKPSRMTSPSSLLTRRRWLEQLARLKAANLNLPSRDPKTPPNLIDLTAYYNMPLTGTDTFPLSGDHAIQTGQQALGDVVFDMRGTIRLASFYAKDSFPRRAGGIHVSQKCKRLHFLHFVAFTAPKGATVATFDIRYADGTVTTMPLRYGHDVRATLASGDPVDNVDNPNSAIAWRGTGGLGVAVRLFRTTWENPKPAVQITTIDFISNLTDCAPNLVAITAEP
ncbi:MAG: protein kinase, partial [Verrucomicrobia subdivision 3 bacterium]|nr:protein kinase [Limisphaerales bacterium]